MSIRSSGSALALILLGLGGVDASVSAQEPLEAAALAAKIDSLAAATLEIGPVASLSIGVRRGEDLRLTLGYGLADVENGVPATPETVYRIGSITKQFTAASVLQLVEEGRIGLDDSVNRHLPDYPTQGHDVTIRHLLTHTSGIKSYTGLPAFRENMRLDLTDEELVDLFEGEPFDFAPGEQWLYNNSGYYLLGMVIEAVSGEAYRDYVERHLFDALGLSGSSYCDERRIIHGRAEGYEQVDGQLMNDAPLSMNLPGAGGALCSTVPDLLAWTMALRAGDVVSEESYRMMSTPAELNDGSSTGYGFGLMVGDLEGHPRVAHGGGINGFVAMLAHYPEADLDVVVLSNTGGGHAGPVAETISRWALGVEVAVVGDEPMDPAVLAAYEGTYRIAEGLDLEIFVEGDRLFSRATGQSAFGLRAQGEHVFVPTFDDTVRVTFLMSGGRASGLTLLQGGRQMEAPRIR